MDKGTPCYRLLINAGLLLQVLLMVQLSMAGEEDCLGFVGHMPIKCYECSSLQDDFCGDPFNDTHPGLQVLGCKEYCVKWSRTTLSGMTLTQRTCSNKLTIGIRKTTVCIEESRPSEGQLCFCNEDKCNSSHSVHDRKSAVMAVLLATCVYHILSRVR
ncbi:protein quiver-like isoform X2 [Dreissena polymorpha]|uniref:UPAR/Ly6 domain-containing protein qvr n=1 Tax=Dreissena polymorpha TaxID=45954 RepID=A0A9D3YUZ3_DREPO|nr:protein quiver-like isoform X1 [Dreissena polymorpha]XP_052254877.1 protein quiver-like isoform X2 [Dreissena polymorpha]KAH3704653.1 hypothetical protein DPMN_079712 [Dreissena polymorpha]